MQEESGKRERSENSDERNQQGWFLCLSCIFFFFRFLTHPLALDQGEMEAARRESNWKVSGGG
jgi:hypothetical protein